MHLKKFEYFGSIKFSELHKDAAFILTPIPREMRLVFYRIYRV